MKPTEMLKQDHREIERRLAALSGMCDRMEAGQAVPVAGLEEAVEFIRTFADKRHHGKEEDLLFPALAEAGLPRDAGPVAVMLAEHEMGRQFVRALAAAVSAYKGGDESVTAEIVENARGYISLLTQHIFKEDNILFPMADSVLSPEKQEELTEAFEKAGAGAATGTF
ncbi:MAG: hemerythrin domain-containing protein [Elusimicrobia bacterium]|nr:hemerythrin domain-containing protein [Elusimicrobiota bacterium]